MNVACLFSGGKDSVFSIYIAKQWGWDISHLITISPKIKDSWMYHSINIQQSKKIAKALDIKHIFKNSLGIKEEELKDLKKILKNLSIDGIISGAISSEYQRTRIEKICHDLKIKSFTPLWHKNQLQIIKEQLKAGFKIMIVGVSAYGLDKSWLGKLIDYNCIKKLISIEDKYKINIAGEGGEYETLTIDGPIYKKKLIIDNVKIKWNRDNGFLYIKKSHLG
jgi:ABC transporter with metal-binding/Fe-S-binding domain ATP-binding protein